MLILSRKPGTSVIIGDDITVTILNVEGKQVKVGVDAPSNIPVHREEIYLRIQNEKNNLESKV